MPSSTVRTFSDLDDYAAAIRQGTVELTVTARGYLTAKHVRIDLHCQWMQRFSENLSRIYHVDGWGGRAIVAFRTQAGPSLVHSGVELQPSNIVRFSAGQSYYQHLSGPTCFASMSLPVADMVSVGAVMAGCDLTPLRDTLIVTPLPSAMAKLQRLYSGCERLHVRRARAMRTGTVRRPTRTSPIIFLIWAATVCLLSLNIRKELPRLTATRSVGCSMFHSPVDLHGIARYWSD